MRREQQGVIFLFVNAQHGAECSIPPTGAVDTNGKADRLAVGGASNHARPPDDGGTKQKHRCFQHIWRNNKRSEELLAEFCKLGFEYGTETRSPSETSITHMEPIMSSAAALAVAVIFYTWRAWQQVQFRRERLLRERVAYMLWVMANQEENEAVALQ